MSTWTQRRERDRERARRSRPAPTPDEIDDRQVDRIDFAHQTLDEFIEEATDPTVVAGLLAYRERLPPRMDGR